MSENYNPLFDFLQFVFLLPALVLVHLLAHHSVYPIISRHLPNTFTLFTTLLHIVTFCAFFCVGFTLFHCVVIHCHLPALLFYISQLQCSLPHSVTHFLQRDGQFCVFWSLYVTLLIALCYW